MSLDRAIRPVADPLNVDTPPFPLKRAVVRNGPIGTGQSISIAATSALLIFAVLAFGGIDRWAIAILEIGSALLVLLWIWPQFSSGHLHLNRCPLYPPIALFGLLIAVQVVSRSSAYVHVTRFELWKYAAYGCLFLFASQCDRASARRLLTILAVFGFIVALFTLVQYFTYNGRIYWVWPALPSSVGPYVDHNHYAGLMEMIAPIPLAMALMEDARRHGRLLWMIAAILMAATIFVSGSRGGMIAFVVQMVFLAGLIVARTNRRIVWTLMGTCLVVFALALWVDSPAVLNRLGTLAEPLTNDGVIGRLAVARDVPRMVRDRPIAGWGLGLFPIVYPQYRSFSTDLIVNHAHNDYLQVLVETGILGFACVLWFIVNLYRAGFQNFEAHSTDGVMRALGPLVGCTGILVHSFSEFNLHMPANAALFFVLSGIASGATTYPEPSTQELKWFRKLNRELPFCRRT